MHTLKTARPGNNSQMLRKIFFSVTAFCLMAGTINTKAQVNKAVFEQNRKFQIEGKINGYQPGSDNGLITFRTYTINGRNKDTGISIDKSGNFICELYQPFEGDILLIYNDEIIDMYASPSEKVQITIDEFNWKSEMNKNKAITFLGKSATISKEIIEFEYELKKQKFRNNPDLGNKEQGDEGYAKVSIARMKEELDFLNNYIIKKQIKNKIIIQWLKNKIIYSKGVFISFYFFVGKINKTITYTQLMNYLAAIPINNPEALHNSDYFSFLNSVRGDLEIITNINPLYEDSIRHNGNSKLLIILEKIDAYARGIAKELMYYFVYKDKSTVKNNDCESNISRFNTTITEPYLKGLFNVAKTNVAEIFVPFNIIERIKSHPAGDSLSNRITTLLKKYKDSYIFMDFWGSWCAPCMNEMPYYSKLIERFKGKPIVFLFLAVDTKEEKIKEVKARYQIKGEFISLNNNETGIFNNVLQFSSYPSHFMLDPPAFLMKNKFDNISSGGQLNELTVQQIENAMSKK
jgi:thiol-disulfide isomerase/thioredoxin